MEENRFDPLQFIGFLLISGILMFWFYDNQSNLIENQDEIVDDDQIEVAILSMANCIENSENIQGIHPVTQQANEVKVG